MDSFKDNLYPSDSHVYTINELKYINRLFLNFIIYLLHSITLDNFPFWNFCLLSILLLMMISNLTVTWLFIQILFEVITFSRMAYDHYGKMSITLLADVGQFVSQIIHLIRKIPGRNWYSYICCLLYFSYNNEFYRFQFLLIHVWNHIWIKKFVESVWQYEQMYKWEKIFTKSLFGFEILAMRYLIWWLGIISKLTFLYLIIFSFLEIFSNHWLIEQDEFNSFHIVQTLINKIHSNEVDSTQVVTKESTQIHISIVLNINSCLLWKIDLINKLTNFIKIETW